MYILGIETSCDETAAAVAFMDKKGGIKILSNVVSSQIEIHKKYGGVVPEVAAREHVLNIIPVIKEAISKAKIKEDKLSAIAITAGPGLVTSLIIGTETARTLAYVLNKPLVPVNHIEGHIYANFIGNHKIKFPALVLTVSGGHTNLVLIKNHLQYKIVGETLDDAAGEAFDKGAKMLDVGYPGGPAVSALAKEAKKNNDIKLPRPMLNSKDFDFSFSGLKTALLYELRKDKNYKKKVKEYCLELEQAIVDILVSKTIKAAKKYRVKTVMLSGGVAANRRLREELAEKVKKEIVSGDFYMPDLAYTTDNAAMIAAAGCYRFKAKKTIKWPKLRVDCNLELK